MKDLYICDECLESRDSGVSEEAPCAECGTCAVCAPHATHTGGEDYCRACFTPEVRADMLRRGVL